MNKVYSNSNQPRIKEMTVSGLIKPDYLIQIHN